MRSLRIRASASVAVALALAVGACNQATTSPQSVSAGLSQAETGNGAPSGPHFNLNIIGVKLDKKATYDATSDNGVGHRIFVRLNYDDGSQNGQNFNSVSKLNKIFLTPGDDFAVLDANATDSDGALFQLPSDVSTTYAVYARALGSPKNDPSVTITTCAVDPDTGEVLCSTDNTVQMRTTGKSSFENVSKELLTATVVVDTDTNTALATCLGLTPGTGDQTVTVNLFDSCFENYFWDYDNHGLKLLQLRFYPI
jgi:hypothetical protein